jgi:hypothetical protein
MKTDGSLAKKIFEQIKEDYLPTRREGIIINMTNRFSNKRHAKSKNIKCYINIEYDEDEC